MLMDIKKLLILVSLVCACFHVQADNEVNYIEQFGRPKLVGNQLSDENGDPIQLKGVTAFSPDYENCLKTREDLFNLREMGVNCVRIARLISGEDIISDEQVKQWMAWTQEAGLYCIIDWNFMNKFNTKKGGSGDPNDYIEEATEFFQMVAQEVVDKQYKHVIYEICNEPSQVSWTIIKNYAEAIIGTITGIDTKKPIIIVGTPNWCQNIYSQVATSDNKITTDKAGIMYAFHFYAGENNHIGLESAEFLLATRYLPIFVTEWSLGRVPELATAANNTINTQSGAKFMNHCLGADGSNQIVSWIYNSYGSGGNGAAMFKEECGGDLSEAGEYIDKSFRRTCCSEQYYVKKWGHLQLVGNQLSDENGNPIQLKGFSAFSPDYDNCLKSKEDLDQMRAWGMNCVRISKVLTENGISNEEVKKWMSLTREAGMYCIIDWHILEEVNGSGNPNDYIEEASAFFRMVAQEVADKEYKHIIYELCNEPSGVAWATIKSYEEAIIDLITGIDTLKPVIIAGVPNWDQYINTQVASSNNLIETDKAHVMYAFHLFANETDHIGIESSEFLPATNRIPVFVSEWNLGRVKKRDNDNNPINLSFGSTFLTHCAGLGGSGQLVSWIYNAYGSGGNGAGVFTDECGTLSASGQRTIEWITPSCCSPLVTFTLDNESENEVLNMGNYDENPNKQDGELASGSGITYYDVNNTPDEQQDGANPSNYDEKATVMSVNQSTGEEREALVCYAGREYCDFRSDECVDIFTTRIEGSWSTGLYSLDWIEPGEWLLYTVKVNSPGYYSLQMAVNPEKVKTIESAGFDLSLPLEDYETFMVDIDKSTETQEVGLACHNKGGFIPYLGELEKEAEDEYDKVWCNTGDNCSSTHEKKNYGILFKKKGTYIMRLSFPYGHAGLGGLRFTYAKAWRTSEANSVNTNLASSANIYPTIVEEGHFTVSTPGKATVSIYNVTGTLLQTEEIDRTSEISTKLASGVYNVQIVCEGYTDVAKIIIK